MLRRLLEQATNERDHWKTDRDAVQKRLDEEREENETLLGRLRDIQRDLQSAHEEIEELREDLEDQPRVSRVIVRFCIVGSTPLIFRTRT